MNANEWSTEVTTFAEQGLQKAIEEFNQREQAFEATSFTKEDLLNLRDDIVEWIRALEDISGSDGGFLDGFIDKFYEMRDGVAEQINELDECEWLNNEEAEQ
jgi:hypothetical protein